ncbi:unnamed protein product, partial [Hapterophycus canaliculatus]
IAVFTCLATWLTVTLLSRFVQIRVPAEAEKLGLNYTEHGESIGLGRLQNALDSKLKDNASFANGIAIDPEDEHSDLASTLNQVIGKYESATEQIRMAQNRFKQFAETASDWLWESDNELSVSFFHSSSDASSKALTLNNLQGANLLDILEFSDKELEQLRNCITTGQRIPLLEATIK